MAFDCPRAPGQGEPGDDGIAVAVEAGGTGIETGQIVLPDGDEPVRKTLALALGQRDGEGADVSGERVDLGAVNAHGFGFWSNFCGALTLCNLPGLDAPLLRSLTDLFGIMPAWTSTSPHQTAWARCGSV